MGSLLLLLIGLAIFGAVVYAIVTYIPMPALMRQIIIGIACVAALLWMLDTFGIVELLNRGGDDIHIRG